MTENNQPNKFQVKPPPTDPAEIHFKNAWQHRKNKQFAEAVEEFLKSLQYQPDKAATHFNLGIVYDELGKGVEAVQHATKAEVLFFKEGKESNIKTATKFLKKLKRKYSNTSD